jgi:hypothetical protein
MPGAPTLRIQVFDSDDLFGDDMIGETFVDLDDRFFNPEWAKLAHKPIEYRQLYLPSSQMSQGMVSMWVDIERMNNKKSNKDAKDWCLDT